MYKTPSQARALMEELRPLVLDATCRIAVFPPAISLPAVAAAAADSNIQWGGQNIHQAEEGAYTGDISAAMLEDIGCRFVLCGHSERRLYYGETDAQVAEKAAIAWQHRLTPVICVGETLTEREAGRAQEVVSRQLRGALASWDGKQELVIAYEPVWAIGTGLTATPADAQEMSALLRQEIAASFGSAPAAATPLLYGGSVKPDNTAALLACTDVDGALVGGASLTAASFAAIVQAACC